MVNRAVNGMNSAVSSMNEGGRGGVMGAMASAGASLATKAMDAGNFVNNAAFSMAGYNDKSVGGPMAHNEKFNEVAAANNGGREETDTQVINQKNKQDNKDDEL